MKLHRPAALQFAIAPSTGDQTPSARQASSLEIYSASVVAMDAGTPSVRLFDVDHKATIGVLLPALVVGDCVAVVLNETEATVTILGVLVPNPASPLRDRAIKLESNQVITLQTGSVRFEITGDGTARVVAHRIEQDARDLVRIDAAEIRMN